MNFTPEECDRHPSVPTIRSRWNSNSFIFRKIMKEETLSLKNLNKMIPSHALKIAAQELADPLKQFLINVSQRRHGQISRKRENGSQFSRKRIPWRRPTIDP